MGFQTVGFEARLRYHAVPRACREMGFQTVGFEAVQHNDPNNGTCS